MADLHKFTSKEILNKVLVGASKVGVTAYQLSEVLSLVFDEANVALRVSLDGGTPTVDAITIAEGTVPDTPDTGYAVIWFDTSDNHLKTIDDTGATVDLAVGLAADFVKTDTPGTPDAGSIRLSFDSDNIPHATDENGDEVLFTVIPSESGSIGSVAVVDSVQSKLYLQAFAKTFDKNVLLREGDDRTHAYNGTDTTYGDKNDVSVGDVVLVRAEVVSNTLDQTFKVSAFSGTGVASLPAITDVDFSAGETGVKYGIATVVSLGTDGLIYSQDNSATTGSVNFNSFVSILTALGTYTAEQVLALASLGVTVTTSDSWATIASATGYSADIWDILIPSHVSSMEPTIVSSLVNRGGNLAYIGGGIKNPSYSGSGSFHDIADAYGLIDDGFYVFSNSTASNKGVSFEPWYVNPNTAYICSANYDAEESSNLKISEFDCDGNYLAQTTILSAISGTGSGSATFTTNSRTAYIKLSGLVNSSAEGTSKFTNIQLNEGSTANTYSAPLDSPFTVGSRSANQLRNGNGEEDVLGWDLLDSGVGFSHDGTDFILNNDDASQAKVRHLLPVPIDGTLIVNVTDITDTDMVFRIWAEAQMDTDPSGYTWNANTSISGATGFYEKDVDITATGEVAVFVVGIVAIQLENVDSTLNDTTKFKEVMVVKGEYTLVELQALGYVSYEPVTLLSCPNNAQTSTVRDRIYGQGDKIWLEHNVQTVSGFKYGDPEIDATLLNVSNCVNASAPNDYDTFDGVSATGFHVISTGGGGSGQYAGTVDEIAFVSGSRYKVSFDVAFAISGTVTAYPAFSLTNTTSISDLTPSAITNGHEEFEFISSATTTGVIAFRNASGDAVEFTISNLSVQSFNIQENLAPTPEDITEFCNGSLGQPADQGQNHIVAEGGVELGIVHYLGVGAVTKDLSEALQTKANKTDVPVPRFLSVTRENASAGTGNLVYQFSDMAGFADYYENIDGQGYTLGTNVSDIILFPNAVVFVKSAGVASGEFLGSVTVSSAEAPYFYTGD